MVPIISVFTVDYCSFLHKENSFIKQSDGQNEVTVFFLGEERTVYRYATQYTGKNRLETVLPKLRHSTTSTGI